MCETEGSYINHWNDKFLTSDWGRYPPEELVRFIGRYYKKIDKNKLKILEVGCGPGANLWFLHREGYQLAGIDASSVAVQHAKTRLETENKGLNIHDADIRVGNFSVLPWENNFFDIVIDIFSIYANYINVIEQTIREVYRVLKPGGKFFCKLWGTATTGFEKGDMLEDHTFDNISVGPCAKMGVSHFFDEKEIYQRFNLFQIEGVDRVLRTDYYTKSIIEEFVCTFKKPN